MLKGLSIRILSPAVAAKIAAGEVVERPASIVKELIENSLDAGARRIAVEVVQGGIGLIRVSDDGCGIAADEMAVAFERHATSKLSTSEDLTTMTTLGFRGEALPSIAAVAEVEMVSRPEDDLVGAFVRLVDGRTVDQGRRAAAQGTTIAVKGLFARQPARRTFLRSPEAEARQIAGVLSHYALAHPKVSFSLRIEGRQSLNTGGGSLADAVAAVYGAEAAATMLTIDADGDIAVRGLVGPPTLTRASRNYVSIFINRRWVQNRRLTYAVEEAYHGLLTVDRHPVAIVNVTVPASEVDVNVHPAKAEVRFRNEGAVFAAVQKAVRQALLQQAPMPALGFERPAISAAFGARAPLSPVWRGSELPPSLTPATAPETVSMRLPKISLPALRVVGQIDSTYIVAEGPDGMYLIDQHAAHERVLFEEISAKRGTPDSQGLLAPLPVELSPAQEELLRRSSEALAENGFVLEPFGARSYLIRSVPAYFVGDPRDAVMAYLERLGGEEGADVQERVLKSLACHGAVRAGKTLSMDEMRELVRLLEATQLPNSCPHGRPTMVHMSTVLLEREFRRR